MHPGELHEPQCWLGAGADGRHGQAAPGSAGGKQQQVWTLISLPSKNGAVHPTQTLSADRSLIRRRCPSGGVATQTQRYL